ncbi:LysR family transcriptional regulator [Rhizobium ruizarguesonis]|uniref:HTH-type transcriptional regulator TtuA n=1 Tax=Rhizobium ruizarguesonis TaxID=2081791 RepID=A0AB38HSX0_9HYPH|nr:LysR family transcriptional regulator [Rhizobium ruizarguesonis]TBA13101.1 LysR family transcriptional regulator [Rhizobium ruizarguesonis]TBA52446.1 LysR family transcriptional regulator [Rhizobium ruizarguesonis]TBB41690.1 LysR family transcriptional regulator [Rhizobium ruizarguesonis]TBB57580.1 LysR family transcriptional regulator [Rhizobium ruizarguesonis]TBB60163.1 LysR family transcriptional regulator [Rhizobium ruizarguesonis]
MDTRFLETFVVVAERHSLAEAAQRLNLTPAAVAQRIRALEAELGVRLLVRSGRVMRPTEAGFAILERCRDLVRDTRDLKAMAGTSTISGEMRIGAINTALTGIVPGILHRLAQDYPLIEIFLKPGASMDLYAEVLNGALDAAFIIEPRFPMQKTLTFNKLRQEPLVLIAPRHCEGADPFALLTSLPFIRYDRNQWGGHIADEFLRESGIHPVERYELDALEAIAVMVDRGLGISIVPDWAPPWPAGLDIVKLLLPRSSAVRTVGIVVTRSSPRANLVAALLETSRAAMGA